MGIRHLALAIAAAISFPVAGYAQESSPTVTRAQVRAELVQLESVGYWPGRANDPHYPDDIQAAEAAVASQQGTGRASAAAWVVCAAGRPLRATASPRVQRSTRFTRITDWQRLHHPMKHA
jgi:hypothetical protein